MKIKVLISKIQFYGFVGNVNADLGLPWFSYRVSFGSSRAHFRFKKTHFFQKKWFFRLCDKSADLADINEKNVRESCVLTVWQVFHNIGHIHNTNFAQTQFSRSYPQKTHFFKKWNITFFWKYLVCGSKIEISEYLKKYPS